MKRRKPALPVKPLVGLAIFFVLLLFGIGYLGSLGKRLELFQVRDIIIRETPSGNAGIKQEGEDIYQRLDLSYLKGRNIFYIDLEKEERLAAQFYPGYSRIQIIKILPNRLFVNFVKRKPIASVKFYRYFYVDEGGVLFDISPDVNPGDMPVILGLETKIFSPQKGAKYNVSELTVAIDIIKAVRANSLLKDAEIKIINVQNPADIYFLIALPNPKSSILTNNPAQPFGDNLEVRTGQHYIADKISILGSLLAQSKKDVSLIKYIDLRFKEPVVKFKDKEA